MPLGIKAAGAILFYMEITHHDALGHVSSISRIDEGDFVWIDKFTFRNLEVFHPLAGAEGVTAGDHRRCSSLWAHADLGSGSQCPSKIYRNSLCAMIQFPLSRRRNDVGEGEEPHR